LPEIGRIQSTNFQSLLTELGITRNNIPFALRSEVTPVVLVGGTVSFVAAPTPAYAVLDWFTAGLLVAPAINTVMADTGPLPIGAYSVQVILFGSDSAAYDLQWRDAPNAANLRVQRLVTPTDRLSVVVESRFLVENSNERFRVLIAAAGTATLPYQVSILAKL